MLIKAGTTFKALANASSSSSATAILFVAFVAAFLLGASADFLASAVDVFAGVAVGPITLICNSLSDGGEGVGPLQILIELFEVTSFIVVVAGAADKLA